MSAFASGPVKSPPQLLKCLRSATNYALLKFTLVSACRHYAVLENPLYQAWDLLLGYSCFIGLRWTPAQEDLVSLPGSLDSQTLPNDLVRAYLLSLLRSSLVISLLSVSAWLSVRTLLLSHTFLIRKSGGWIWIESGIDYEPFLIWKTPSILGGK
jgi:hypothetical protein